MVSSMMRLFSVVYLSLLLSACAGLTGKGDKLYETGHYEEAAEIYEQALIQNPNDEDAKIGLSKARHMIIDRGLIEVRMLRLASNFEGASIKLEMIYHRRFAGT